MMLKNTATGKFHPIFYIEKPFPDMESEANKKYIRYKSKGHHTKGFVNRDEAVKNIETSLSMDKLQTLCVSKRNLELDGDVEWDGQDIPADHQLRERN